MADDVIYAYTDGSAVSNPGPGGWGVVIDYGSGEEQELSGASENTTNNRMELQAVLAAMNTLSNESRDVEILSDSRYVVDAINQGWLEGWVKRGWLKSDGKRVKNRDLWEEVLDVISAKFKFEAVKGHSGVPGNERADRLANRAARSITTDKKSILERDQVESGMVNIGNKDVTLRRAVAHSFVAMAKDTVRRIDEDEVPKGNVLATARTAGIMAAKNAHGLIPLCHQVPLDYVKIKFTLSEDGVEVTAEAQGSWRTGFEMEALVAVSVAALTIYDMCKRFDSSMELRSVRLSEKSGGRHKQN